MSASLAKGSNRRQEAARFRVEQERGHWGSELLPQSAALKVEPRFAAAEGQSEMKRAGAPRLGPRRISSSYGPTTSSTIDSTASKGARRAPSMWCRSARDSGAL